MSLTEIIVVGVCKNILNRNLIYTVFRSVFENYDYIGLKFKIESPFSIG